MICTIGDRRGLIRGEQGSQTWLGVLSSGGGPPELPAGYSYWVDENGNYIVDENGNYIVFKVD